MRKKAIVLFTYGATVRPAAAWEGSERRDLGPPPVRPEVSQKLEASLGLVPELAPQAERCSQALRSAQAAELVL